jgi:hypothetical protein
MYLQETVLESVRVRGAYSQGRIYWSVRTIVSPPKSYHRLCMSESRYGWRETSVQSRRKNEAGVIVPGRECVSVAKEYRQHRRPQRDCSTEQRTAMLLTLSSSASIRPQANVASHKADSVDFNIAPGFVDGLISARVRKGTERKGKKTGRVRCLGRPQPRSQTQEKENRRKMSERVRVVWPFGTLSRRQAVVARGQVVTTLTMPLAGLFPMAPASSSYPCLCLVDRGPLLHLSTCTPASPAGACATAWKFSNQVEATTWNQ